MMTLAAKAWQAREMARKLIAQGEYAPAAEAAEESLQLHETPQGQEPRYRRS